MKPGKICSCSIFKGGTGKSTTAVNTAAALAMQGQCVLLVDLDQQASATRYVGINPDEPQYKRSLSSNKKIFASCW